MTQSANHPIPEGTLVLVKARSVCGDEDIDKVAASPGDTEHMISSYCAADDPDNDDPKGLAYYLLDTPGSYGGNRWAYPEHIEVAKTVGQLAAREIPTLKEVASAVSGGLHHLMGESMEFFETQVEGSDSEPYVTGSGRTDEGLGFGVKIAVLEVWSEGDGW